MDSLKYLVMVLFFSVDLSEERPITVMIPQSDPFFVHKNSSLNDLDVKIIETFAEINKYDVKYVMVNETLSEIFATENTIDQIVMKS